MQGTLLRPRYGNGGGFLSSAADLAPTVAAAGPCRWLAALRRNVRPDSRSIDLSPEALGDLGPFRGRDAIVMIENMYRTSNTASALSGVRSKAPGQANRLSTVRHSPSRCVPAFTPLIVMDGSSAGVFAEFSLT